MSDIVERLNDEADRLERRAYGDRCTGPDCALASNVAREAADEIERLRALLYVETVEHAALVASRAEAVEWVREARKFCQDGLAGDGCTPVQALERIHEASVDFLDKLEGR